MNIEDALQKAAGHEAIAERETASAVEALQACVSEILRQGETNPTWREELTYVSSLIVAVLEGKPGTVKFALLRWEDTFKNGAFPANCFMCSTPFDTAMKWDCLLKGRFVCPQCGHHIRAGQR